MFFQFFCDVLLLIIIVLSQVGFFCLIHCFGFLVFAVEVSLHSLLRSSLLRVSMFVVLFQLLLCVRVWLLSCFAPILSCIADVVRRRLLSAIWLSMYDGWVRLGFVFLLAIPSKNACFPFCSACFPFCSAWLQVQRFRRLRFLVFVACFFS